MADLFNVVEGLKESGKRTEKDEILADYVCEKLGSMYTIQSKVRFSEQDREGTRAKFLLPPEKGSKTMIMEIARVKSGTERMGEDLAKNPLSFQRRATGSSKVGLGGLAATVGAGLLLDKAGEATVKQYKGIINITVLEPNRGFLDKLLGRKKQKNSFSIVLDEYVDNDLKLNKEKADADLEKWLGWI